jgi:phosphatidylinositol 4-kinase
LEKIQVEGDALYLPTDPTKLVKGIELDSGIPLQSAAKVPIMITFDVVDKGDQSQLMRQACIFKVGRVLLLQKFMIKCWVGDSCF